jgi:hypothetical protein
MDGSGCIVKTKFLSCIYLAGSYMDFFFNGCYMDFGWKKAIASG